MNALLFTMRCTVIGSLSDTTNAADASALSSPTESLTSQLHRLYGPTPRVSVTCRTCDFSALGGKCASVAHLSGSAGRRSTHAVRPVTDLYPSRTACSATCTSTDALDTEVAEKTIGTAALLVAALCLGVICTRLIDDVTNALELEGDEAIESVFNQEKNRLVLAGVTPPPRGYHDGNAG